MYGCPTTQRARLGPAAVDVWYVTMSREKEVDLKRLLLRVQMYN